MLLERSAHAVFISVEEQQALRQLSVVKAPRLEHIGNNSLVVAGSNKGCDVLALILYASCVKLIIESKLLYVVEEFLFEVSTRFVIVSAEKSEHILEHTAGSSTGRNKLYDLLAFCLIGFPLCDIVGTLTVGRSNDATANACCCLELQERKAFFKLFELGCYLFFGYAFFGNLL